MRTASIVVTFALLTASLAGAQPRGQVTRRGDIILGGLFNLTGAQAELDVPTYRSAQLAVDEINAGGGLLGRNVTLVAEDGKSRPEKLEKDTEKILRQYPTVAAFLGLSDTDMVLAAAPVAAAGGRLFLTSGATSPKLPAQVPQYLYLACFGDNVQAAAAAEFAFGQLGAHTASVLYDSTDTYTSLLQGYFRTRFTGLGGQILSAEPYSPGDLSGPISKLQSADVIFLSAHLPDDALQAVSLLRGAGFTVPIIGGDGYDDEQVWSGHTEVEDVYFTTHVYLGSDTTDQQVADFRAAYAAEYPGEPVTAFAALGYDAVKLIAEAIQQAGSDAPADVLSALGAITAFDGVTGEISYSSGTRIPVKSVSIIRIDGGSYGLANEWVPAVVPAP